MGKRKILENSKKDNQKFDESPSEESSSENDTDMLDVDFEWFDPQPEHDFHGLKTLIRQLLDVDAQVFDLGALVDLILAQPLLGSTVKVDGNESDPYAFLTVLNLREHRENATIQQLTDYLIERAATNPDLSGLENLLKSRDTVQVGLILTERLINIPAEVVPPMYKMLLEEISWALDEKEPYSFTHYLVLSKTYQEVESSLDQDTAKAHKRKKQKSNAINKPGSSLFYFHPEDEVLQRHVKYYGGFDYVKQQGEGQSDSRRAFQDLGIKPQGHLMLIEADEFAAAVDAVEQYLSPA